MDHLPQVQAGREANVLGACRTFLWIASTSQCNGLRKCGRGRRYWRFSERGQGGSSFLGLWERDWTWKLRQHRRPRLDLTRGSQSEDKGGEGSRGCISSITDHRMQSHVENGEEK